MVVEVKGLEMKFYELQWMWKEEEEVVVEERRMQL